MRPSRPVPSALVDALACVHRGAGLDRASTGALVRAAHTGAMAYLRRERAAGRLHLDFFGLALPDLAMDCVADLFERDDVGRFVRLSTYLSTVGWPDLDDTARYEAWRRLVTSATVQGLYRRFRTHGPQVHRLVRMLKEVAPEVSGLALRRRAALLWVEYDSGRSAPGASVPSGSLDAPATGVVMDPALLAALLAAHLPPAPSARESLHALRAVFGDMPGTLYAPRVPLTALARLLIDLRARRYGAAPTGTVSTDAVLSGPGRLAARDLADQVARAVDAVGRDAHRTYVATGKLDPAGLAHYLVVVRRWLEAAVGLPHAGEASLFALLQQRLPALTRAAYRAQHRARLEYLARQARTRLRDALADDWRRASADAPAEPVAIRAARGGA